MDTIYFQHFQSGKIWHKISKTVLITVWSYKNCHVAVDHIGFDGVYFQLRCSDVDLSPATSFNCGQLWSEKDRHNEKVTS